MILSPLFSKIISTKNSNSSTDYIICDSSSLNKQKAIIFVQRHNAELRKTGLMAVDTSCFF